MLTLLMLLVVLQFEMLDAKTALLEEEGVTRWYDPGRWIGGELWLRLREPTNEVREGGDPGDTSQVSTKRTASCFSWLKCVKQTSQRLSCSFHAFLGLLGICNLSCRRRESDGSCKKRERERKRKERERATDK